MWDDDSYSSDDLTFFDSDNTWITENPLSDLHDWGAGSGFDPFF